MERRTVCGAGVLLAVALLLSGCGDTQLPVHPSPSSSAPTTPEFSVSGQVTDTAFRPLGGVTAQVIGGPRDGTVSMTNAEGRFSMPGTFAGSVTVRASKDGYVAATNTVPPPFRSF